MDIRILVLGGIAMTQLASANDTLLVMRDHAVVNAESVRLRDILDTSASGGALSSAVADVPLWQSPRPCQTVRIDRAGVEARIQRLQATPLRHATVTGATRLDIEAACQRVEAGTVEAVATQALSDWLRSCSDHFDVVVQRQLDLIELPPGKVSLRAKPFSRGRPEARTQVWVDVEVDGRLVRSVPVVFQVHAFRDALFSSTDIVVGTAVSNATLARREIDIAGQGAEPLRDVPENVRLRKTLVAGEALTAAHVEARPQVARGSSVVVRSRVGAIAIEARAEALQDGSVGHPIWVRVVASTAPLRAYVVAEGVVELAHD